MAPLGPCQTCGKEALLQCGACSLPDLGSHEAETFRYCSATCQKAHWPKHKSVCLRSQTARKFDRATEMLLNTLKIIRVVANTKRIDRIDVYEPKTVVLHDHGPRGPNREEIFFGIQDSLLIKLDEPYQMATLFHEGASDALGTMYGITKHLLSEIATDIHEYSVTPINKSLNVVVVDQQGNPISPYAPYQHRVLKVTLKCGGGSYYLDLTAGQFGHRIAEKWEAAITRRVQNPQAMLPQSHGTTYGRLDSSADSYILNVARRAAFQAIHDKMVAVTTEWEKEQGMTLTNMLSLPEDAYELQKDEWHEKMKEAIMMAMYAASEEVGYESDGRDLFLRIR